MIAPDLCLEYPWVYRAGHAYALAQACLHPEYPKTQLVDRDRDAAADAVAYGAQASACISFLLLAQFLCLSMQVSCFEPASAAT